jgi:hypothetical protein
MALFIRIAGSFDLSSGFWPFCRPSGTKSAGLRSAPCCPVKRKNPCVVVTTSPVLKVSSPRTRFEASSASSTGVSSTVTKLLCSRRICSMRWRAASTLAVQSSRDRRVSCSSGSSSAAAGPEARTKRPTTTMPFRNRANSCLSHNNSINDQKVRSTRRLSLASRNRLL